MPAVTTIRDDVEKNGFAVCRAVVSATEIARLLAGINRMNEHSGLRKKTGIFASYWPQNAPRQKGGDVARAWNLDWLKAGRRAARRR